LVDGLRLIRREGLRGLLGPGVWGLGCGGWGVGCGGEERAAIGVGCGGKREKRIEKRE